MCLSRCDGSSLTKIEFNRTSTASPSLVSLATRYVHSSEMEAERLAETDGRESGHAPRLSYKIKFLKGMPLTVATQLMSGCETGCANCIDQYYPSMKCALE